jgi:predicted GIY-YIG superfamily endonuclease
VSRTHSQPYAGTVYLLHLDRPLAMGRNQFGPPASAHYLGWTAERSPTRRVAAHRAGRSGSKYMRQAYREGIVASLARVWPNVDRHFERKLKRRKASGRLCPVCIAESLTCAA